MLSLGQARHRAFTLLETVIATGISALFLGSLFVMNT